MSPKTLLQFLMGRREAILEVATNRQALGIGLLFVLSAALARDYDGADLLAEPWHLLIPLIASTLAARVFWGLLCYVHGTGPNSGPHVPFTSLLSLFWMTAPLAWLYAIPVERFLGPADAASANLGLLGIVALWRVVLMIRATTVILGCRLIEAVFLVLFFASCVMTVASFWTQGESVLGMMGGMRDLSQSEAIVAATSGAVCFLSGLMIPIAWVGVIFTCNPPHRPWQAALPPANTQQRSGSLWLLAVASVLVWLLVLPATQAEQQLKTRVEQSFAAGQIAQALDEMSAHSPGDFPPHWEPPPQRRYWNYFSRLLDVMEAIVSKPPAPWVRAVYVERFRNTLGKLSHNIFPENKDVPRLAQLLFDLEEGPELERQMMAALEKGDPEYTERIIKWLKIYKKTGQTHE